jgi:multiple sugar transport system permease protein
LAEHIDVLVRRRRREERCFQLLLFLPTIVFLVLMVLFPLVYSVRISFYDYVRGREPRFIGFGNYAQLFRSEQFWLVTWVTLRITLTCLAIEMGLGLLLGFALSQKVPGMGVFRVLIFLPMMLAPLVAGLFWRLLLDQTFGLVNFFLERLGFQAVEWLTDPRFAIWGIIITDVWQWTPFVVLLVLAGLGTIPQELQEAATLDRASPWMRFRNIYLPYLRMPILLAVLFRSIDTLKMFDVPYILTGGGPGDLTTTLSLLGYRNLFSFFKVGVASAISWFVVIIVNVLVNILLKILSPRRKIPREMVDTGL